MVDGVSKTITPKTTVTDADVSDVSNKKTDDKGATTTTDRPPTVRATDTGKSEGAPPLREPRLDSSSIMEAIEKLRMKTDELQMKTKSEQIDNAKKQIDKAVKKQVNKIAEQAEKLKSQQKWGLFGKIFGGIALVCGVIAAVASGGALAIGVAVLASAIFVAQETGVMDKVLTGILNACGVPKKDQDAWKMGIQIGLAVLMVVATAGASTGSMTAAALRAMRSAQVIGGLAGMVAAGTTAGAVVAKYDADQAGVDLKNMQSKMLENQHQLDELMKQLKELLEKLEQGTDIAAQVVGAEGDSVSKQIQMLKSKA